MVLGWRLASLAPHALGGLVCRRRGASEGCAMALSRGRAGGGPEGRRCWEPPHALGGGRSGAPEGCTGGVCHSPAEGVRRRGCAGGMQLLGAAACPGRPPTWEEGCAEGCAIALPRGLARGGCRC